MKKTIQNTDNSAPIGVFDSGVGGTSIWNEINTLLPNENSIYLADSKYAPYGTRPREEIIALSEKNTILLLEKGCKIIVVACNTATTNAIQYLRDKYDVPFIGIEPAIKPAYLKTVSKTVGILATKGTLSSALFQETSNLYKEGIEILEQEGTGIVELIEQGMLNSEEMMELLQRYTLPMVESGDECISYFLNNVEQVEKDGLGLFIYSRERGRGKTTLAHYLVYNAVKYLSATTNYKFVA